jgi:hypothetical protein
MASLEQRGDVFYIQQYYVGTVQQRVSTGTSSYQLAKEKLRQFESAQLRGDDNPLCVLPSGRQQCGNAIVLSSGYPPAIHAESIP